MSVRMLCPYFYCSATVEAKWMRTTADNPDAMRLMVPEHDIQHTILQGPCPAGLMWIPLNPDALSTLIDRARANTETIRTHLNNPPESIERNEEGRAGGLFPHRPLYPGAPGQLPGRMGREPGPKSRQWTPELRGGPEPQSHENEPGVSGYTMSGRGTGMASISELIGMTTEANTSSGEALGAIAQANQALEGCLGAIERAKSLVAGVLDDSNAQTMSEYLSLLNLAENNVRSAHAPLEQALGELGAGMERGESFIGNLMS